MSDRVRQHEIQDASCEHSLDHACAPPTHGLKGRQGRTSVVRRSFEGGQEVACREAAGRRAAGEGWGWRFLGVGMLV